MTTKSYAQHSTWIEEITQQMESEDSPLFPLFRTEYQAECICGWVGRSYIASDEDGNYADSDDVAAGEALDEAREHLGGQA